MLFDNAVTATWSKLDSVSLVLALLQPVVLGFYWVSNEANGHLGEAGAGVGRGEADERFEGSRRDGLRPGHVRVLVLVRAQPRVLLGQHVGRFLRKRRLNANTTTK